MSPRDPCIEDIPVPVMVDIMSRLPVKKIIHCKCVCKKWLNIVLDAYFADIQLSGSPAGFLIYHKPGILKWVAVEDKPNHHNLHHDPVMSLDLNLAVILKESQIFPIGSVNGLVCLWQVAYSIDNTYICNPITREYMILPRQQYYREGYGGVFYCFGVGSLTQKYKVIRIFRKGLVYPDSTPAFRLDLSEAEVYTLGRGQWRSLGHVPCWFTGSYGRFLNGHAHWQIDDQDSRHKICSFNFYNETFELFPTPPSEATEESQIHFLRLEVLKGCLCRCDTYNSKLMVWVMKEYGIKKSWHKELVIKQGICPTVEMLALQPSHPVESLKDGTVLMVTSGNNLIVYCPQRKAIIEMEIFDGPFVPGVAYRPSFHRLQNFENESVHAF